MTEQCTTDAGWDDELPAEIHRQRAMTPGQWRRKARDLEAELDEADEQRVDILTEAAHAWEQASDLDAAERCYRQLVAEQPDPDMPDPRVPYAQFLLERRAPERGRALLQELWDERGTDPNTYFLVAESHEHQGCLHEALNWCNAGVARCYPEPFNPAVEDLHEDWALTQLLSTRVRVRQLLDQPADALDELVTASRQRIAEGLETAPVASEQHAPAGTVVPYWPWDEFDAALRQWPDTIESDAGTRTHLEHRRDVERALRRAVGGQAPRVAAVRGTDFDAFHAERSASAAVTVLQQYAAQLDAFGEATTWPPGRNEMCWCGSGRKYKKCCGSPGFVVVDPES